VREESVRVLAFLAEPGDEEVMALMVRRARRLPPRRLPSAADA
jgi:hypothetical protein